MVKLSKFIILAMVLVYVGTGISANPGSFGIRAGIGTDISGGIAYGGGINYLFETSSNPVEVGLVVYGGSFEETTEEFHTYTEKTDILVIGVMANYLFNYQKDKQGLFFLLGGGIGAVSVEWEESSPTDESLGPPLAGGGSKQTDEGSSAGFVLDLGIGYKFNGPVDMRFEIPIIIITGAPEKASSIAPTFTLSLGVRF